METKCPTCGAPLENGKCGYCGYKSQENNTGNSNGGGQPQPQIIVQNVINNTNRIGGNVYYEQVSRKDKSVAFFLCVFLGYFGAHQFYVGKVGMGFLYFFTVGLFGFGWLYDIFRIATGSFKDSYNLPLR